MMFKQTQTPFDVIGQVWREVVGCRNWSVMRVPQFIALRRNVMFFFYLIYMSVWNLVDVRQ